MANDLNDCKFIGRLGKDPELKYFQSGDAYLNLSIAVGKSWKDKNSGDKKEATTWVPLVFTGKIAEIAAQYCKKGSQVFVSGEYKTRKWQKDGVDQYTTEIHVLNMQLLGGKPDGAQGGGQQSAPAQQSRPAQQRPAHDDDDSNIPF